MDRIRVLLGNFWREILRGRRHSSSSQVTSATGIPFSEGAFFSKLKFRVLLLFLNWDRIARIVPKECTLSFLLQENKTAKMSKYWH